MAILHLRSKPSAAHSPVFFQSRTEVLPVFTVPTSSSKNIGLPFGRQHQELNFSNALIDSAVTKRAPPREPRAWPDLVCAGGALLDRVQAAFLGTTPPGRESSTSDLENGWERSTETTGESLMILGRYWSSVFDDIYPASRGKSLDVKPVNLHQTGKYKTEDGTEIDVYWPRHFKFSLSANILRRILPGHIRTPHTSLHLIGS